jgi:hypothetical protein
VVCRATPAKAQAAKAILKAIANGRAVKLASNSKLPYHFTRWYATHLDGYDRLLLQVIRIRPGIPYLPSKSMPSESLAVLEKPGSIG